MNAFFKVPAPDPKKPNPLWRDAPDAGREGITKGMVPRQPVRMRTVYPVGPNSFRIRRDK